jgi:hypothetical protein
MVLGANNSSSATARGQAVLVRVLQKRLDARPVLRNAVGKPVGPDDRLLFFEQRLKPSRRHLGRTMLGEKVVAAVLGGAQRLVEAERDPWIALIDVAADHDGVHDRVNAGAAEIVLLGRRIVAPVIENDGNF